MTFDFEKEIKGTKVHIEIKVSLESLEDKMLLSKGQGYKCSEVIINKKALENPAFVTCYSEGGPHNKPVLGFKFGAAKWLIETYNLDNERTIFIEIPEDSKESFAAELCDLDHNFEQLCEEANKIRDENDQNIAPKDRIQLSYSPRFIAVKYPFDSNRAKEESRLWSEFEGDFDLAEWIEEILEPYCTGLGCGCSKKYEMNYDEYKVIFEKYKKQREIKTTPTINR
ncbi:MAG: hypothetical protein RR614_04495 [Eubacterium sp.]